MRSWSTRAIAVLGTSTLIMAGFAGAATAAEPNAAPAQSHADAQFLSGSLFNGLLPFDFLLALRGASATNTGQSTTAVQRNNLLVTLFGFPIVSQPHGLPANPADTTQGGYANQYAQASPGGSSRAASGALNDSGVIGDNQSTDFPSDATINLSAMKGDGAFSGLQEATLKLSTITSEAALTAGAVPATTCADKANPVNCLDYSAAKGTLSFTSPQLKAIPDSVTAALAPVDAGAAQLQAAVEQAVKAVRTGDKLLDTALSALGGGSELKVSVNLGLAQAVVAAVKAPITAGGVTLDPSTGKVTIDIGSFVKLNDRAPNTTLIDGEKLFDISPAIPTLTAAISQRITDAATAALNSSRVTIDAGVSLPLGAGSVSITSNATLLSLADGTATASIDAKALGVPINVPASQLLTPLKALTAPVVATVNTATTTLAAQVSKGVGATLQDQVKPATLSIPGFLTIKVNVQSSPAPGVYQVSALQIGINAFFGNLATINLATSRVGANTAAA